MSSLSLRKVIRRRRGKRERKRKEKKMNLVATTLATQSVCNATRAAHTLRSDQYVYSMTPSSKLPHLNKTLNVQQVVYNTLDIHSMNIQHIGYTKHECTTPSIYKPLNVQHFFVQNLGCTTTSYLNLGNVIVTDLNPTYF